MGLLRRFADRAARVGAPVLLLGETGTGKSLLARAMVQPTLMVYTMAYTDG